MNIQTLANTVAAVDTIYQNLCYEPELPALDDFPWLGEINPVAWAAASPAQRYEMILRAER